ncbi:MULTISPECIES: cytochrome b [unclassified Mesorhizobium]|uniref:cytochrome b n=1 Tax=unclassified Mesorhizobium TaxID=325217 RepID=UPI00112C6DC3|nr:MULTISPECIES: cytochrome b [unclassified Mesorhizobium]MBZ9974212.1 cytochrome b [Mesorhizobium sp. BR-1-1-10]TPK10290.1 cytochrome b [Mesorhizobium sp. B2-5-7]
MSESGVESRTIELEYYDRPTLWFHWLTVVFVVLLFGTSLVWNYVTPRDRTWRPLLEGTHVSLGILFAGLILVRIVWRLTGGRQLTPEVGLSGTLSQLMYIVLYVLLAAESMLGFVLRWAQGEEFTFFGLFTIPALMAQNRDLAHTFEELHNYVGWAIVILAAGHAIAALVHHYVLRDKVFGRMWVRRQETTRGR